MISTAERFWTKVDRRGDDECWLWTASTNQKGYGQFEIGTTQASKKIGAHKWAYETLIGPVPIGLELDHTCRVRRCCNPRHLEAVTHLENVRRGSRAQQTHCKWGHEFTIENTKRRANGTRLCRACDRRRSNAAYWKRAV